MTYNELKNEENKYVMNTYGRFPIALDHGKGATLWDVEGKKYIDLASGIGVNCMGYDNQILIDAITRQAHKIMHASNLFTTEPMVQVAKKLVEKTHLNGKVFFANSGAESNEGAIKLARKYSFDKYGEGRYKIVTLINSFHGRTVTTLKATGQDRFHNYFFPFLEGFDYVVANDIADLDAKIDDTVCAILIEYVQGEGGVMALEQDFVDAIYDRCAKRDILVMTDEVQTGMGRTGTLLAGEQFGHHADVVTLAKGIAGGLPMGACLANEKCSGVLGKSAHGSTFGGNPVCCAGGLAVLQTLTADGFLASVQEKAAYLREKLAKLPHVQAVTGLGLMVGIQLDADKKAIDVVNAALEQGLLLLTAKDRVRLLPPLTISKDELDRGVAILADVLSK